MFNFRFCFFALLFFLVSCNQQVKTKTTESPADPQIKFQDSTRDVKSITSQKIDNQFHNIAALLCGQKSQANQLNYLFDSASWASHAAFIDSSWQVLEKNRLSAMKTWGKNEFAKPNSKAKVVFYPFSGPDYLTAQAFFPDAQTYIMLGLEPVGKLPDIEKFNNNEALDYTNDFRKSLSDLFDKSYFITQKMLADFQKQKVNGLLPVLSFFIQKTGGEITDVRYLLRYGQDSISEVPYDFDVSAKKPFGVRIFFTQNGKQKSTYYFKYDVSNNFFNDSCVFYKFINAQTQACITYIKSASYLLHANFMSNMRNLILENSIAVVEDDTGIPFDFFEGKNDFDIQLYGAYTKPVKNFPYLKMQKGLQAALHRDSAKVKQLPFHLGYHWGTKKDIIIFAQKKSL